jgi:transposase
VIATVRLRRRRRVCSVCGQLGGQIHDQRLKRWRHLDLGSSRCVSECELRRLWCRDCGVQLEAFHWPERARATRVTSKTRSRGSRSRWPRSRSPPCCRSRGTRSADRRARGLRPPRRATLAALAAPVGDRVAADRDKSRRTTTVVDHCAGAIVWCAAGRNYRTLQAFFEHLGAVAEAAYPVDEAPFVGGCAVVGSGTSSTPAQTNWPR